MLCDPSMTKGTEVKSLTQHYTHAIFNCISLKFNLSGKYSLHVVHLKFK